MTCWWSRGLDNDLDVYQICFEFDTWHGLQIRAIGGLDNDIEVYQICFEFDSWHVLQIRAIGFDTWHGLQIRAIGVFKIVFS